jgi:two-component system NtrC family sensor kinase
MRSYLEKINKSALLCNNIINKLLTFSRKREYNKECLHINSIVTSTLELKEHDLRIDEVKVITDLSNKLPMTIADFYGLQQVFLNLINNAHQAMIGQNGDRILTIKSECKGKNICVSFCDTGPGIPQDNLQKIFEPLFTTKDKGEGTGLGLSICYEIVVNEHKGNIFVASEYGHGACFVVEIPVVKQGWDRALHQPGQKPS